MEVIRADGYDGRRRWLVSHGEHGFITVYAVNSSDAIWLAAKHWGMDPRRAKTRQELTLI